MSHNELKIYYINTCPIINHYAAKSNLIFQDTVKTQCSISSNEAPSSFLKFPAQTSPSYLIPYPFFPVGLACEFTRSLSPSLLLVGLKNDMFYHQKSQTWEKILQQIIQSADCIRGKDEMIRKAANSLWDANNCAYRLVIILYSYCLASVT